MGAATAIGLTLGGLSAATSFMNSQQQASQQRAQASALSAQAAQARSQARLEAERGRIEAENIDREKSRLRRQFEEQAGRNRSLLAAGNVDMASGSAMDVQLGNINLFASDLGENAYQKALKEWETREQVRQTQYQADIYDSQASSLRSAAGNVGASLLTAGLQGATGFLSGYSMAGGKLFGSAANATAPVKWHWFDESGVLNGASASVRVR